MIASLHNRRLSILSRRVCRAARVARLVSSSSRSQLTNRHPHSRTPALPQCRTPARRDPGSREKLGERAGRMQMGSAHMLDKTSSKRFSIYIYSYYFATHDSSPLDL